MERSSYAIKISKAKSRYKTKVALGLAAGAMLVNPSGHASDASMKVKQAEPNLFETLANGDVIIRAKVLETVSIRNVDINIDLIRDEDCLIATSSHASKSDLTKAEQYELFNELLRVTNKCRADHKLPPISDKGKVQRTPTSEEK